MIIASSAKEVKICQILSSFPYSFLKALSRKNRQDLDRINLEISDISVFCLLGQSRVGKSTLVHLLLQLLQADVGEIRYDGEKYLPDLIK